MLGWQTLITKESDIKQSFVGSSSGIVRPDWMINLAKEGMLININELVVEQCFSDEILSIGELEGLYYART